MQVNKIGWRGVHPNPKLRSGHSGGGFRPDAISNLPVGPAFRPWANHNPRSRVTIEKTSSGGGVMRGKSNSGAAVGRRSKNDSQAVKLLCGNLKEHLVKMLQTAVWVVFISPVQIDMGRAAGLVDEGQPGVMPKDAMRG